MRFYKISFIFTIQFNFFTVIDFFHNINNEILA